MKRGPGETLGELRQKRLVHQVCDDPQVVAVPVSLSTLLQLWKKIRREKKVGIRQRPSLRPHMGQP